MRSEAERIWLLHQKAAVLENRKRSKIWGAASAGLTILLFGAGSFANMPHRAASSGFVGTSLLRESIGGYVLVGVISFITAVCITVCCIRRRSN